MTFTEKYLKTGKEYSFDSFTKEGEVAWECPSNIALVKYWGKRVPQLPLNPSLSFTLNNSITRIEISYFLEKEQEGLSLNYYFEGKLNSAFSERIKKYLNQISEFLPFLKKYRLEIKSHNTFPHSSGIASSASAFGALALCLVDIESRILGITIKNEDFFQKASFLARLGSGSASRSVYGGFCVWGNTKLLRNSSDELAISVNDMINPLFRDYCDTILLIDEGMKDMSSSAGHALMGVNPFSETRFKQAGENLEYLLDIMKEGNLDEFVDRVEYEALCLHAMMLTSYPGYTLLKPQSLAAIEKIRIFRRETKIPVAFTIDAGANIHVLYPKEHQDMLKQNLFENELIPLCVERSVIEDFVGEGPVNINQV